MPRICRLHFNSLIYIFFEIINARKFLIYVHTSAIKYQCENTDSIENVGYISGKIEN